MILPDIEISRLEDVIEHLNSKVDSMDSIQKHLESEIQRLLDVICLTKAEIRELKDKLKLAEELSNINMNLQLENYRLKQKVKENK